MLSIYLVVKDNVLIAKSPVTMNYKDFLIKYDLHKNNQLNAAYLFINLLIDRLVYHLVDCRAKLHNLNK